MNSDSKSPLLGSVSQNPYQMGYLTVKTIIDIGEGKDVPETIVVPGDWISP
jgi:ABC-type sugar transport system substrate-binding protein